MSEEANGPDENCVPCRVAWNVLLVLGVAAVAFIAADVFTQGKATEWAAGLFGKSPLASVIPLRPAGGDQGGEQRAQ